LIVEKKAGVWRVLSPVDDLADGRNCLELAASLSALTLGPEVSADPASYAAYGLAETTAARVRVYARESAAAALDGWLGKPALGGSLLYFRASREKPVFLAGGPDADALARSPENYRERRLFPEALGRPVSIRLSAGSRALEMTPDDGDWNAAAGLRIAEFADARSSLGAPAFSMEFRGTARASRWDIGGTRPEKGRKPVYRYARSEDRPGVVALVPVFDADALLRRLKR
jgi:hypothetical protein